MQSRAEYHHYLAHHQALLLLLLHQHKELYHYFYPYGENIENLQGNHLFKQKDLRGYTGHKQIPEANLIDMNARIYDPVIARFTSPDTMIPHPDTIQPAFPNNYTYELT